MFLFFLCVCTVPFCYDSMLLFLFLLFSFICVCEQEIEHEVGYGGGREDLGGLWRGEEKVKM